MPVFETSQQPILDSLYAILNNATNVTAYVASRIYDTLPPQNPTNPFIVISVITDPPQGYFASDDITMEFQLDVFGKLESGPKATRIIGDAAYGVLNRNTNITASGYAGMSILCVERGTAMDMDLVIGPRTQQDSTRLTQQYRLFGSNAS